MILIMPIVFVAIFVLCMARGVISGKTGNDGFIGSILALSSVLFVFLILVITNLLSVFDHVSRGPVFAMWVLVTLVCLTVTIMMVRKSGYGEITSSLSGLKFVHGSLLYKIIFILIAILSLILLFGAIYTVPYNYDSMTYHLARVGYWIDHKNVAHYITNIDRQIYSPVLCEYVFLHMMVLSGNDLTVNLVQYFCLLSSAYFVFANCRKLGVNEDISILGAFLFMTMPLSISESIATQNDLFATLIFLLFVYYLIDVISWDKIELNREQMTTIILLSSTVAFAYLLKTSVCASMIMFMPWLLIVRIKRKDRAGKLIASAGTALVTILVLISETLIRTYRSAGSIMTDTASGDIMVATKNVSYILVNICKNFSILITQHLVRPLNGVIYRFTISLARILNVEVNNEAIAFHGFDFLRHMNMGDDMYSHDKTPSALVAYMALISGIFILIILAGKIVSAIRNSGKEPATQDPGKETEKPDDQRQPYVFPLGFAVSTWLSFGFIMALLRWQPWGTRLLYPALSVTVIMSMTVIQKTASVFKGKYKTTVAVIAMLSIVLSIPSVTYNLKPAVKNAKGNAGTRMEQYFVFNRRYDSFKKMADLAKENDVKAAGLIISGDGFDYPLWLLFKEEIPELRIGHIVNPPDWEEAKTDEKDVADLKERDAVTTAIIISERDVPDEGEWYEVGDSVYKCVYSDHEINDALLIGN